MEVAEGFSEIGARVRVRELRPWRPHAFARTATGRVGVQFPVVDIRTDKKGEYFDLAVPDGMEVEVIDSRPDLRHLVLMARLATNDKARYLCGHDERHWFVAAVPESFGATTVPEAQRALQPDAIKALTVGLDATKRIARHNSAYRRQGEWFFVPAPDFEPDPNDIILRNEPLRRDARSKPHVVAEAIRSGGETRYQADRASVHAVKERARAREIGAALNNKTLTAKEHAVMAARFPEVGWRSVLVNPTMYVRGPVRHSDHSTVNLRSWHRVVMNAESLARAASSVAFID